jgi:pimeloyl-ACP methyl ester carboxylesterase
MPVNPFYIPFSLAALDDLRERLRRTRWPEDLPSSAWQYGFDLGFLQEICTYWAEHFDWKAQVERLSQFHHYRYTCDGIGIHFIHERGKGPAPIPLILTHGWPGSFLEMMRIVPLLTDPAAYGCDPSESFDVVVPSLPGYGFSDQFVRAGMNTFRIADLWTRLMKELGYNRFAAQGGDIGASVSTILGFRHAHHTMGIHLNYIPTSYRPYIEPEAKVTPAEDEFLKNAARWSENSGAYSHIQRTHPRTAAYFNRAISFMCPAPSPIFRRRNLFLRAPGSNADTTFNTGPTCRVVGTSPLPKNLSCWRKTFARSFAPFASSVRPFR